MGLIFHNGQLLFGSGQLAMHENCCCELGDCDSFHACFGTPDGGEFTNLEAQVQVSGVADDECDNCEALNVTFDPTTPGTIGLCTCSMSIDGGPAVDLCAFSDASAGEAAIFICGSESGGVTAWTVTGEIFITTQTGGVEGINGSCYIDLTGQDALDFVNELCSAGTAALVMTHDEWFLDDEVVDLPLCDCIGATITVTLTEV